MVLEDVFDAGMSSVRDTEWVAGLGSADLSMRREAEMVFKFSTEMTNTAPTAARKRRRFCGYPPRVRKEPIPSERNRGVIETVNAGSRCGGMLQFRDACGGTRIGEAE